MTLILIPVIICKLGTVSKILEKELEELELEGPIETRILEYREKSKRQNKNKKNKRKKLQVLGNIRRGLHQTNRNESKKRVHQERHKTNLCSSNLINKNTCVVPLVIYLGPFLNLIRKKHRQMNKMCSIVIFVDYYTLSFNSRLLPH